MDFKTGTITLTELHTPNITYKVFSSPPDYQLIKLRVRVTLQLAVYRQTVHLGAKPLETHNQRFFFN
jgi:hypothetical protein